jgi:hypothetical protein
MKNLLFNKQIYGVAIFILLASCSRHTFKKASVASAFPDTIRTAFFQSDSIHYFKTSVRTYGKELSGILAIKQQHADTLKVSFFTEMGVSFFDALVMHDSYQLIRCIPQLDSKAVMGTIIEDIRWVVLFNRLQLRNGMRMQYRSTGKLVRFDYGNEFIFAELTEDNLPLKISYAYGSKFKSKFEVSYGMFERELPVRVVVEHHNFNMKIELTAISFEQ